MAKSPIQRMARAVQDATAWPYTRCRRFAEEQAPQARQVLLLRGENPSLAAVCKELRLMAKEEPQGATR